MTNFEKNIFMRYVKDNDFYYMIKRTYPDGIVDLDYLDIISTLRMFVNAKEGYYYYDDSDFYFITFRKYLIENYKVDLDNKYFYDICKNRYVKKSNRMYIEDYI